MAIRGSAAWVLTVVLVTAFVVGALLLTVVDPVVQGLFDSSIWTCSTSYCDMTLGAGENMWAYIALVILLGFLSTVWVTTRRAG